MGLPSLLTRGLLNCSVPRCTFSTQSAAAYCKHSSIHRLDNNFKFRCPFCVFKSSSGGGLQKHIATEHSLKSFQSPSPTPLDVPKSLPNFKCSKLGCEVSSLTVQDLKKHLSNDHLKKGESIDCPFGSCPNPPAARQKTWHTSFSCAQKFLQHMTRCHKNASVLAPPQKLFAAAASTAAPIELDEPDDPAEEPTVTADEMQEDLFQDSDLIEMIAKFYAKLEGQLLLPSSNIQTICEDLASMLDFSRNLMKSKLFNAIRGEGLSKDIATKLSHLPLMSDPLYCVHHKIGSVSLSSEYLREEFYKLRFHYRKPSTVYLLNENKTPALDANKKVRCIQMLSIRKTVEEMLEDDSVAKLVDKSFDKLTKGTDNSSGGQKVYRDFTDGLAFKSHPASTTPSISLIGFQDGFGVTNPIGAAKNKHKTIGVYLSLGNLPPEKRSKVDTIKLIALIPEAHLKVDPKHPNFVKLKYLRHRMVWRPIVEELKDLQKKGVLYKGVQIPVYLQMMLGDDLGSHQVGGFTESFSGNYWCRYCDISKEAFFANPHIVNNLRTKEEYTRCANEAQDKNIRCVKGVKFNSIFNEIDGFHVCNPPSLPPCIAHDLWEGIVAADMPLMIKHFIAKKWFTRETLNRKITHFKFDGIDSSDKPNHIELNKKKQIKTKLSGQAVQNWNFLRYFSLILGPDCILDVEDPVWVMYLHLKHLCERVCAPEISHSDVLNLKPIISEYLYERQSLFPANRLKPKHHFLMHYPGLIVQFGPLLRLFTLRMESKHPIFKKIARMCQNFINIYYTMANKHQLREAYQRTGPLINDDVNYAISATKIIPIFEVEVASYIQEKVKEGSFHLESVSINGTLYQRTKNWVIVHREEASIVVGQIVAIFCQNDGTIIVILKLFSTSLDANSFGLHEVYLNDYRGVMHIDSLTALDSFYPLNIYQFDSKVGITLKYWPLHI